MLDLQRIDVVPTLEDIGDFIGNPLFQQFYQYMLTQYHPLCKIEYSKDVWFPGWNVKLKKAGKSLCVIYPKEQYFTVLVVIGKKEKERAEQVLPQLSEEMQTIYRTTKEGNGQRWLMIDLHTDNHLYQDVLTLIQIRRESK